MLRNWTEILPLFVIRLLAEKCETLPKNGMLVKVPRPGVMIQADTDLELIKERRNNNWRQWCNT